MLASAMQYNRQVCGTSLRISTLAGGEEGLDECDLLSRLSIQALRGESLTMLGGVNRMSRLDIRDAVGAIRALLCVPSVRWAPCYNVDSEEGCDLQKIARFVAEVVARLSGRPAVDVLLAEKETADSFGMDASRFRADTGWAPKFTIMDTIESVVHYYLNSPEFADLKYLRGGTDT
jgi:nucleoside-diphosphate-sugar epimerase